MSIRLFLTGLYDSLIGKPRITQIALAGISQLPSITEALSTYLFGIYCCYTMCATVETQHGLLLNFIINFNTFLQTGLYGNFFLCIGVTKYSKYATCTVKVIDYFIFGPLIQDCLKSWAFFLFVCFLTVTVDFTIFFFEINFN